MFSMRVSAWRRIASETGYEEDTEAALADLLARAGFTGDQVQELQRQLSREAGDRALVILAGYSWREVAEHLSTVMVWNDAGSGERS